jgi:hypothetical protein
VHERRPSRASCSRDVAERLLASRIVVRPGAVCVSGILAVDRLNSGEGGPASMQARMAVVAVMSGDMDRRYCGLGF